MQTHQSLQWCFSIAWLTDAVTFNTPDRRDVYFLLPLRMQIKGSLTFNGVKYIYIHIQVVTTTDHGTHILISGGSGAERWDSYAWDGSSVEFTTKYAPKIFPQKFNQNFKMKNDFCFARCPNISPIQRMSICCCCRIAHSIFSFECSSSYCSRVLTRAPYSLWPYRLCAWTVKLSAWRIIDNNEASLFDHYATSHVANK